MENLTTLKLNTIGQKTKKNYNKEDKCVEENKTVNRRKSEKNFVTVKLSSESLKTSVSLDKFVDIFAYFKKKSNLKYFYKNKNVFTLANLSKASFITSLELATKGKSKF